MSVIYHGSKLQRLNYPAGVSHLKHPGEVGRWPRWPIATWWFSVIQLQFVWSNAPITFLQVEVLTRDFMKIQDRWGNFQQTASHYRRLFALPCEGRKNPSTAGFRTQGEWDHRCGILRAQQRSPALENDSSLRNIGPQKWRYPKNH